MPGVLLHQASVTSWFWLKLWAWLLVVVSHVQYILFSLWVEFCVQKVLWCLEVYIQFYGRLSVAIVQYLFIFCYES